MLNKKSKKRKILVITGSRGEYGYIRPLIQLMNESDTIESEVLATNMHLLPEFGNSLSRFHIDNIPVEHKIYMALSGFTNASMVKSLGVFMLSIGDILFNNPPDIILLAGDKGEQLIAAIAGAHMNIPVAHIQAGELSGNIDGMSRHAITRFTHIHFAANEDAETRLINMGEEHFRIFKVGASQLDEFFQNSITSPEVIAKKYSLDLEKPILLVVQHPVTEQAALSGEQMKTTMKAITSLGHQSIIIYPNNDAGSISVQECIMANQNINMKIERNVSRETYGGLMNVASAIVGNSSSGIIEAPSFQLPAINIGRRQKDRFQGKNVINVENHENIEKIEKAIRKALSREFKESLKNLENPYGDGKSCSRILKILETIPLNEKLLFKKITY